MADNYASPVTKKYLDYDGLTYLSKKYPTNEVLEAVVEGVSDALDEKVDKVASAVNGNIAKFGDNGNIVDSGIEDVVQDVQIDGTSVVADGVANIPMITSVSPGIAKVDQYSAYGINVRADGTLQVVTASDAQIKSGTSGNDRRPITPANQHASTFYGLAKAAGDTTQSQSSNTVGTYTDEAKSAIQTMLDVPAKADIPEVPVQNVQVDGVSILSNGVANIPKASSDSLGVVKTNSAYGIGANASGQLYIYRAGDGTIKSGTDSYQPIAPDTQHEAVFYGLAKAAGADEKESTLPVGQYTDEAKAAIFNMLGLDKFGLSVVNGKLCITFEEVTA